MRVVCADGGEEGAESPDDVRKKRGTGTGRVGLGAGEGRGRMVWGGCKGTGPPCRSPAGPEGRGMDPEQGSLRVDDGPASQSASPFGVTNPIDVDADEDRARKSDTEMDASETSLAVTGLSCDHSRDAGSRHGRSELACCLACCNALVPTVGVSRLRDQRTGDAHMRQEAQRSVGAACQ